MGLLKAGSAAAIAKCSSQPSKVNLRNQSGCEWRNSKADYEKM